MKKFNKLVAMLLVLVMAISLFATAAMAVDADTVAIVVDADGNETPYSSLDDALLLAFAGSTVYLVSETASITTDAELYEDVTFVIPTSADYKADNTTTGHNISGNGNENGKAYATLVIPADTTLTVNGTLIVAGNQQGTNPRTGFRTGDYGAIDVEGSLEVNGALYARGEIYTNTTGSVTITKSGSVYQRLQIADWRGGTASEAAFKADIFPFSLYGLGGISAKLVLENGASLYGQSFIYASGIGASINVPIISHTDASEEGYTVSGSLISFVGDKGTITLTWNDNQMLITVNGAAVETGNLTYSVQIFGITLYKFSSADTDCPFGYNTDLTLENGASLTIKNRLKILPGCTINVEEGTSITIAQGQDSEGNNVPGSMNFYGAGTYQKDYYHGDAAKWTYTDAATLVNNGTVTVEAGNIISSSDKNFDNVQGFEAKMNGEEYDVVTVLEYNQTLQGVEGETPVVPVTFYVGTPITTA